GVAATIIGALLTSAILSICRALVPDEYILLGQPHFTARVLVVLFCAAFVITVLACLPALFSCLSPNKGTAIYATMAESRGLRISRVLLVFSQSMIASLLLVGALFIVRSYWILAHQSTGIAGDALAMTVSYPDDLSGQRLQNLIDLTLERLELLPG